jgi:hypothetical protein
MKSPLYVLAMRLTTRAFSIVIIGFFIYLIFPEYSPDLTLLWNILSLLTLVICYATLYHTAWRCGERDRNLVKYNHLSYKPARGFIAGGCAAILPLLSLFLFVIADPSPVKIIYFTVVICIPLLTGVAYLNGHKLKRYGISIVYKKRK